MKKDSSRILVKKIYLRREYKTNKNEAPIYYERYIWICITRIKSNEKKPLTLCQTYQSVAKP